MPQTRSVADFKPSSYKRLTSLIRSRFEALKQLITKVRDQNEAVTSCQIKTLQVYETEIQRRYEEFEFNVSRALDYNENDAVSDDQLMADQSEISNCYTYLIAEISDIVETNLTTLNQSSQPEIAPNLENSSARLPKLELPKFNGDYAHWTTFINLFNTAIHNKPSLPKITKFQYLLTVLTDEALNLVRNLAVNDSNYDVAYNILTDRYQNDRRLQLLHINRILDLPDISVKYIKGIRHFLNSYTENVQALSAINCDITSSNSLLVAVLLRKLDLDLKKKLETMRGVTSKHKHTLPTVSEIIAFLNSECDNHEDAICSPGTRTQDLHVSPKPNNTNYLKRLGNKRVVASNFNQSVRCICCDTTNHRTFACPAFLSKTPQERFNLIKMRQHCISCLGMHDLKSCKSQSTCKFCHKRHNTLLHFPSTNIEISSTQQISNNNQSSAHISTSNQPENIPQDKTITACSHNSNKKGNRLSTVLLGTLLVNVRSNTGNVHTFRALLDTGSMSSLLTERAANLLNAKRYACNIEIVGINQQVSKNKGQVYGTIETLSGVPVITNHAMVILNNLTTHLPRVPVSQEVIRLAQQYQLADSNFHSPNRIDIILGAAICPLILSGSQIQLGPDLPYLIQTQFGHIVMGISPCSPSSSSNSSLSHHTTIPNDCFHTTPNDSLHDAIQQFWVQEDVPSHNKQSLEDIACERLFTETHLRDEDGRYIVRLPFKESHSVLGSSRTNAEIRLKAMERKFANNEGFASLYRDFMSDYINLGHMSECDDPPSSVIHYYLPHHGVLKESSSTTKLRTVFDASSKSSSGVSLNDLLMTGSRLQTNVSDILIQFRRHNTVICCDIKQMYRQILIHPDDRHYQMILWRSNTNQPIKSFQLNTVTYGVSSSPYLAIRTLHQLAMDEGQHFPNAAHALLHNTYVDDIITGADSIEEALELQDQLQRLLNRGGFELRKWVSNSEQLLQHLPEDHKESPKFVSSSNLPHFTVLGLHWSPTTDSFSYSTKGINLSNFNTKRTVLSTIAQIYDPCGFLTPFIMTAKCLMQLIWTLGLNWDSPLPAEVHDHWTHIVADIHCLDQINISRTLNLKSTNKVELHGFCDASERGYAAVIYFRVEDALHNVNISLVIAKSRVAPLKKVTIPRLELCAAHLLSKLTRHIINLFPNLFKSGNIWLWSDSTVTLTWIKTPPYRLKTYVGNRVAQIQEATAPELWHHISTQENPADCASRGLLLPSLVVNKLWWNGPSWLSLPSSDWPASKFIPIVLDSDLELKPDLLPTLASNTQEDWDFLTKFSSWTKLIRTMAFVLRFINNCRESSHQLGFITTIELNAARTKIFSLLQQKHFSGEIKLLSEQKVCPTNIQRLNPFLDQNNLIRVGGRLSHSTLPFDVRHPILLPKQHNVVNILIDHYHLQHLHAGPQLVQSLLRQNVWILSARNVIRSRIHKCVICFKTSPKSNTPLMGDIPGFRLTPCRPFSSTGIDYAGPYTVKIHKLRSFKQVKVYICIFVCMTTKATHIEVVTNLTTSAFIAALVRFTSRRGLSSDIYSDCATNFTGASAELKKVLKDNINNPKSQEEIQNFVTSKNIKFHFNPPAAPHFGGLWENAVKGVKRHLQRVIGKTILTLPEFMTLTVRIEAMLNSRPLTPLSSDPSDFSALTPGHFLIGGPLVSLPEKPFINTHQSHLKHWQLTQQLFEKIWYRWTQEYLHTLQQRHKWTNKSCQNINIGDMVIVMQPHFSPLQWPLARVVRVFPGKDNIVRVAEVRTSAGLYTRPVTKLCPLPRDDSTC